MKKMAIMCVALMVGITASADLFSYNMTGFAQLPEFAAGEGAGYLVSVAPAGSDVSVPGLELLDDSGSVVANNAGNLFITGWSTVAIEELTDVSVVVYNAATQGAASHAYISTTSYVLQDLTAPVPAGANEVGLANFSFAGGEWVEVVPEPATIGLMGIAGLGMFLARKKIRA